MRLVWAVFLVGCGFQARPAALECSSSGELIDAAAPPPPPPGFDFAQCPATYDSPLPGPTRYRVIATLSSFATQRTACEADLPGRTHLAVINAKAEADAIYALVNQPTSIGALWIGAVQQRSATTPDNDWLGFDGLPLVATWSAPGEPNDGTTDDEDDEDKAAPIESGKEQFAVVQRGKPELSDAIATRTYGALCECDGVAVPQSVIDAVTSNL